jgi:hypothetical protein
MAAVGACGLVSLVAPKFYAIANCGDCQAILISKGKDGKLVGENLAAVHSSNLPTEQDRLRAEHPNEPDIYVCRSQSA